LGNVSQDIIYQQCNHKIGVIVGRHTQKLWFIIDILFREEIAIYQMLIGCAQWAVTGEEISIYQMLIGCAQWAVTIGRYDIQCTTNTLPRYASAPRQGHMDRALRILGYLKHHSKGKLRFDPSEPNYEDFEFLHNDSTDLYPHAGSLT
jgi:hypothetical protein